MRPMLEALTLEELDARAERDAGRLVALARRAEIIAARLQQEHVLFGGDGAVLLGADDRRAALALFDAVLDTDLAYQKLQSLHGDFWRIDAFSDTARHVRHFTLAAAAYYGRLSVGLEFLERTLGKPHFERLFDERCEEIGLWEGTFSRLKWELVHVEHPARVFAARQYERLLRTTSPEAFADRSYLVGVLAVLEQSYAKAKARLTGEGPRMLAENSLEILRGAAQSAWLPLQTEVADFLGDTRVFREEEEALISMAQVHEAVALARPGDILLERRNWYLSNVGLPGFWPHAALFLGAPGDLAAFFDQDSSVRAAYGGAFTDALQRSYPAAWAEYVSPDPKDYTRRIIEAVSEGVVFASAEHSLCADYIAAMRPLRPKLEVAKAIECAFGYAGRPYDFDFDFHTDSALVCSELVYKAWEPRQDMQGIRLELVNLLGRPTLPPNLVVAQYDRERDTEDPQLGFVFFVDGNESEGRAAFAEESAFRASWRRPKWDVAQD
jgi:hypothetical protein